MTHTTLLDDVRELIAAREREGVSGLAGRIGPAEWGELVPRLDANELALLIQWLPDDGRAGASGGAGPGRGGGHPAHP